MESSPTNGCVTILTIMPTFLPTMYFPAAPLGYKSESKILVSNKVITWLSDSRWIWRGQSIRFFPSVTMKVMNEWMMFAQTNYSPEASSKRQNVQHNFPLLPGQEMLWLSTEQLSLLWDISDTSWRACVIWWPVINSFLKQHVQYLKYMMIIS